MGMLSERLLVTEGNVTGLVRRMEQRNLLQRGDDPRDGRATRVRLTLHGRELAIRAIPIVEEAVQQVFDLPEAELRELGRVLKRIRRAAEEER